MSLKRFSIAYTWGMVGRFGIRGIGIISTLYLVRVLSPADFGIAAASLVVTGFLGALVYSGGPVYIQILKNPEARQINTAWTLQLITKLVIAVIIFLASAWLSELFKIPELENVLRVVSVSVVMQGLSNPGMALLIRALNYSVSAKLSIAVKIFSALATIAFAASGFSYWALILGDLINTTLGVIGSYVAHPYRPRLSLATVREQWKFTRWLSLTAVTGYLRSKIEQFFLSRSFGSEVLGLYSLSHRFAMLPADELVLPSSQPLLNLAREKIADATNLCAKHLGVSYCLIFPAAVGFSIVAEDFVNVFFGEKWLDAIPLMQTLPFLMVAITTSTICRTLMLLHDKIHLQVWLDGLLIAAIATPFFMAFFAQLNDFVEYRLAVSAAYQVALMLAMSALFSISLRDWMWMMLLPIPACLLMAIVMLETEPYLPDHEAARLLFMVVLGGGTYAIVLLGTLMSTRSVHWLPGYIIKNFPAVTRKNM